MIKYCTQKYFFTKQAKWYFRIVNVFIFKIKRLGVGVLVLPTDLTALPIKEFVDHERLTPEMVRDQTNLTNCTSFIKFINRYKSENSLAISKVRLSRRRILFLRLLTTQK